MHLPLPPPSFLPPFLLSPSSLSPSILSSPGLVHVTELHMSVLVSPSSLPLLPSFPPSHQCFAPPGMGES